MLGQTKEGIQHYEVRERDWTKGEIILKHIQVHLSTNHFPPPNAANLLSGHNWWHYGLYHIERTEFERADQIFQEKCLPLYLKDGKIFNILDCTSFLYRLKMFDDQNPREDSWSKIHPCIESNLKEGAGGGFVGMHLMMSCCANKRFDQAEQLIETLDKESPVYSLSNTVLNAVYAYEKGMTLKKKLIYSTGTNGN